MFDSTRDGNVHTTGNRDGDANAHGDTDADADRHGDPNADEGQLPSDGFSGAARSG